MASAAAGAKSAEAPAAATVEKRQKCCAGEVLFCKHESTSTGTPMVFTLYVPSKAAAGSQPAPLLYYLSGLTCTNKNFIEKACAISAAEAENVILVCPDTSPRGDTVPDGEAGEWDFGKGAGFYVDATEAPWSANYNMYSYVTRELPSVVSATLASRSVSAVPSAASIFGHSMGGHGALMVALKNPGSYVSASAFAPICNPSSGNCPWGDKCFGRYLGSVEAGQAYDATVLASKYAGAPIDILVDQGTDDSFLAAQLAPQDFEAAASSNARINATVRMQDGYDHSYYFISTFCEEHIRFHAQRLRASM